MERYVIPQPNRSREIVIGQTVKLMNLDGEITEHKVISVYPDKIVVDYFSTRYRISNRCLETECVWEDK